MRNSRHWALRYGVAVLATVAVTAIRLSLTRWLGLGIPLVIFPLGVMIAGYFGGLGSGLLATVLCAMAGAYFFLEPVHTFQITKPSDQVGLAMFIAVGTLIALLCEALHRNRRHVEAASAALRESEETLRLLNMRLAASNRELQDFASVASHDLQEPLRKIQAFGDRLAQKYTAVLGDEGRDYLQRMQNAAERMQSLINDLLTYSRVASKAQPFSAVDLRQVADGVLSDLEERIRQSGGRVELGHLPTIDADPTQMRQLLQNLIGNALKFIKPDTQPTVRVYTSPNGAARPQASGSDAATIELIVQDDGIGFEEKYTDRIFNVFQRLHGRGVYEGTGIGLAVCRKIAERHGGSITARSQPGQGATFIVTLPVHQSKGATSDAS